MGARICLRLGDVTVPVRLGDSPAARELAARLPVTLRMAGTGIDLCGQLPFSLPFDAAQVHCGWADGDVNYCPAGGWLAVLFDDEENSARYGGQLTLGHVESSLDALRGLVGGCDVQIERA